MKTGVLENQLSCEKMQLDPALGRKHRNNFPNILTILNVEKNCLRHARPLLNPIGNDDPYVINIENLMIFFP